MADFAGKPGRHKQIIDFAEKLPELPRDERLAIDPWMRKNNQPPT